MVEKEAYYRRLDIIRIISCILVLLYHLNILKGGFLAVCTFFVLSGYLSCISALKNEKFSIMLYYKNRIKKLYFPLIIVVFVTVIATTMNSSINWINLKQETLSVIFGYNNFWQLNANLDYFTRNINSPFIHLWYISILLQFDLTFPLIYSLLKRAESKIKHHFSIIVVTIITIMATTLFFQMNKTQNFMVVYYSSLARSFSILFGVLLALLHYKYNIKLSRIFYRHNTSIYILYIMTLIALCVFLPEKVEGYAMSMMIITIISTRLIEYSTNESKKTNKFDKKLKVLSKMSYEVYLVQYPVIFFMQNVLINDNLKALYNFILIFIISFILHLLFNISLKDKMLIFMKRLLFSIIIIWGSFLVITARDYTKEMEDLENRLNANQEFIQERNKEYLNRIDIEKKESAQTTVEEKQNEKEKESQKNTESNIEEQIKKMPVVGIGDSVLLDAIKEFYNKFPSGYFDGKISRTISGAKDILINLKNKGKLGDTVILCLATNGDYSDKKNRELMKILENRRIYWVNAVGADDPKFNDKFKEFAKNYPNIHIVEWDKVAKEHPEYLEPDKIHPNYRGGKAMVKLIYDTIYNDYLSEYKF